MAHDLDQLEAFISFQSLGEIHDIHSNSRILIKYSQNVMVPCCERINSSYFFFSLLPSNVGPPFQSSWLGL